MLNCGLSGEAALEIWLEVDEAMKRMGDMSEESITQQDSPLVNDNMVSIRKMMTEYGLTLLGINGVLIEICNGECGDDECDHGWVSLRPAPLVMTDDHTRSVPVDPLRSEDG